MVPVPVCNVDGTSNKAGYITSLVEVILTYKGYTERAVFAVTGLEHQEIILGLPPMTDKVQSGDGLEVGRGEAELVPLPVQHLWGGSERGEGAGERN